MSKIIKHTFVMPNLSVDEDGNLLEGKPKEETYTFTLLHKGVGIYEELTGESLFSTLMSLSKDSKETAVSKVMNTKLLVNLASASYTKIEDGQFHNNRATAEEFKKKQVVNHLNDVNFVVKLLQMATECVVGNSAKQQKKSDNKEEKK